MFVHHISEQRRLASLSRKWWRCQVKRLSPHARAASLPPSTNPSAVSRPQRESAERGKAVSPLRSATAFQMDGAVI